MEAVAYKSKNAFEGYKSNEIMGLTPVQIVLKLYDFVLLNSKKQDMEKVNAGLAQLIAALNFDHKEVALGFFKLYHYCQGRARKKDFKEVQEIIGELRNAWAQAFKLS